MLNVSYMGTKRQLAPTVADVIALSPVGPMLDLFSGMCAVASAVGPKRQIWCNDIQRFAVEVAAAFFTSREQPADARALVHIAGGDFRRNIKALENRFARELDAERGALEAGTADRIARVDSRMPNISTSNEIEHERALLARSPTKFPYRLFSITFSGGYFSLHQCIEIDSIKFAIDRLLRREFITPDQHRWAMLALCQAACKVANTTGHFAQFLKVKKSNVSRFVRQRRRSVWSEWQDAFHELKPIGSPLWRRANRTIQSDALALLRSFRNEKRKPSVIYADPPYTADHYSRFYHLYETLIQYDYPTASGAGRYRPDRFTSGFSLKTSVAQEIESLIEGCASIGSALVLSYPTNGLLPNSKKVISSLLRKNFRRFEITEMQHFHSSLGGSKGYEKRPVVELIYRAH